MTTAAIIINAALCAGVFTGVFGLCLWAVLSSRPQTETARPRRQPHPAPRPGRRLSTHRPHDLPAR